MKLSLNYIDSNFDFKGDWEIESKCGLKIVENNNKTIVIVTEIPGNPGTLITTFSAELATQICQAHNIDPEKLVYIEHSPDMNSKLSFYGESFFQLNFTIEGQIFSSPQWEKLSKEQVDDLIGQTTNDIK